jgi:hypothetical protein
MSATHVTVSNRDLLSCIETALILDYEAEKALV